MERKKATFSVAVMSHSLFVRSIVQALAWALTLILEKPQSLSRPGGHMLSLAGEGYMYGIIHLELQKFVEQQHGPEAWQTLAQRAGIQGHIYMPMQSYPDDHIAAVLREGSQMTGLPATSLLEAFGEYLVPTYLRIYGKLLKPTWRTLEVIENTEQTIHRVVRKQHPDAAPPELVVERTSHGTVVITYSSARRLCAVARGITRGVAAHFGEIVHITEPKCMHRGDTVCSIVVALA